MSKIARGMTRVAGFTNPELDFQLLRQLGSAVYGGASVGQSLALVQDIGDAGPAAWVQAFKQLAVSLEADGKAREARGHKVSAREQLLLACNAWRAAEYFAPVDAPAHAAYGLRSRQCFQRAMRHMPWTCEDFVVPLEGLALPARFMAPAHGEAGREPRITLIAVSGYDGSMEETYFQIGKAALERGFNLCLFAGPGQMDSLRFAPGCQFEPEYERPVSRLLDMLLTRPEVDPERIALYGLSIGGYFAPRAAAYEPRIKALAANSPVLDYHAYMCGIIGFDPLEQEGEEQDFTLADLRYIPDQQLSPWVKEMSRSLLLRFGQPSFKAVFSRLRDFNITDKLQTIHCPCLAMAGAGEGEEALRQLDDFCSGVAGSVRKRLFTQQEGADAHCQVGNLQLAAAELLDWLRETLA